MTARSAPAGGGDGARIGALRDIRVVDFGHYVAGPLAAMLLADHGADIIHVDHPTLPRDERSDAVLNRGKKRVTLDLKQPAGREAARKLIAEADIVIENFRPGVMARLGLDTDTVRKGHQRLIYCSLPGFAPSDDRAAMPGWEGLIQAATGGYRPLDEHYYTDTSTIRIDDPGRPLFNPVPLASNIAGMLGATVIMTALIVRERTGLGQSICLPLSEAMLEMLHMRVDFPEFGKASPPGSFAGKYVCADGRFLDLMGHPFRFVHWLVDYLGLSGNWADQGALDPRAIAADAALRSKVEGMLVSLFASRPSGEWERIAIDLKIPLALVQTPGEWLRNAFALESRSTAHVEDPLLGRISTAGLAVNLSRTPGVIGARSIPGAADAVFDRRESGHEDSAPSVTPIIRAALEGVKVVDITTQVAGPTAGRILADFGAEVIKISHPETDVLAAHVNRGKKTVLLNIQKPRGRAILYELVGQSDIFLQNLAKGTPERYGIGVRDLLQYRPDLIYTSVSAYAYTGAWGDRRGYEMEGQASAGLQAHYSGPGRWPLNHPMLVNDVGTGILAAFGTIVALYHHRRTGEGQDVNASLSQTATLHQASYLLLREGEEDIKAVGLDATGWSPLQRLYRAKDGWFFLAAGEGQAEAVWAVAGVPSPFPTDPVGIERHLSAQFASSPRDQWVEQLASAGIGAQAVVVSSSEAASHPAYSARGAVRRVTSQTGEAALHPLIPPWLSLTPPQVRRSSGPFGSDLSTVLAELGRAQELESLLADGTVARTGPLVVGVED